MNLTARYACTLKHSFRSTWKINKGKEWELSGYCLSCKGHVGRFLICGLYLERHKHDPCAIKAEAIPALLGMQVRILWPLKRLDHFLLLHNFPLHTASIFSLIPSCLLLYLNSIGFSAHCSKTARSKCSFWALWLTASPTEVDWQSQLATLCHTTALFLYNSEEMHLY